MNRPTMNWNPETGTWELRQQGLKGWRPREGQSLGDSRARARLTTRIAVALIVLSAVIIGTLLVLAIGSIVSNGG